MVRKFLVISLSLYFLALLQTSFFINFGIFNFLPSLVLILIIAIILTSKDAYLGFMGAVLGGFFLDIFSSKILGWHVLILAAAVLFLKVILKKYVRAPAR